MKRYILTVTLAALLIGGGLINGCLSSDQKKEAAQAQVIAAQKNLDKVQNNANKVNERIATADELKTFKLESELKIKNNEVRIAELRLKMNKTESANQHVYIKRIDSLELKNKNLKTRMGNYELIHSDWNKFKRDFNRDLDTLAYNLKNITEKNAK